MTTADTSIQERIRRIRQAAGNTPPTPVTPAGGGVADRIARIRAGLGITPSGDAVQAQQDAQASADEAAVTADPVGPAARAVYLRRLKGSWNPSNVSLGGQAPDYDAMGTEQLRALLAPPPAPAPKGTVRDVLDQVQAGLYDVGRQGSGVVSALGIPYISELARRDAMAKGIEAENYGPAETVTGMVARAAPSMVPPIAVSAATGGVGVLPMAAGMVTAGAQSGGSQFLEAQQRGASGLTARLEGLGMGAFTAATSYIPLGQYLKHLAPGVFQRYMGEAAAAGAKGLLGEAAKAFVKEGAQEASEEVVSMALQRWAEDDPKAWEGFWSRVTQAGLIGGVLGAGTETTLAAPHAVGEMVAERQARKAEDISLAQQTARLINAATQASHRQFEAARTAPFTEQVQAEPALGTPEYHAGLVSNTMDRAQAVLNDPHVDEETRQRRAMFAERDPDGFIRAISKSSEETPPAPEPAAEPTNPAPKETTHGLQQKEGRPEGLLKTETPPEASAQGEDSTPDPSDLRHGPNVHRLLTERAGLDTAEADAVAPKIAAAEKAVSDLDGRGTHNDPNLRRPELRTDEDRAKMIEQARRELMDQQRPANDDDIRPGHGGTLPKAPLQSNRQAWIVLGPPAAGKSGVAVRIAEGNGARIIDSDFAKRKIPGFFDAGDTGAMISHEESTDIMFGRGSVYYQAMAGGDNMVLPILGRTEEGTLNRIRELKAQGYRVHLVNVMLDQGKVLGRAARRYSQTGRYVPLTYILNRVAGRPKSTYDAMKKGGHADEYSEVSTDVPPGHAPQILEGKPLGPAPETDGGGDLGRDGRPRDGEGLGDAPDAPGGPGGGEEEGLNDGNPRGPQLPGERPGSGSGGGSEPGTGEGGGVPPGGVGSGREEPRPGQRGGRRGRRSGGKERTRGSTDVAKGAEPGAADDAAGGGENAGSQPGGAPRKPRLNPEDLPPQDRNHVIERGTELAPASNTAKMAANLDAIKLLRTLETEDRNPTPEEKAVLARYTGWGWAGEYFNPDNARYAKQFKTLEGLLTDEEFASARASTTNAHYTAPQVISAMWDMAAQMGFKGGNVLEPAAGVGHFLGLMPPELARDSHLIGVELDSLSGRILKKLYPQARVEVTGFQDARIPNNSIDLAISNVPFGSYVIAGKDYNDLRIHDYFFARALDKVKPGGLVMFITSDGTMDKGGTKVRAMLAEKSDLVAAFRLPNDAFQENAGTAVTTDIIILRKKDGSGFKGADWIVTAQVGRWPLKTLTDKIDRQIAKVTEDYNAGRLSYEKGQEKMGALREERARWEAMADAQGNVPIEANEYYAEHPENALGKHTLAGTMYGAGDYALTSTRGQDLEAALKKAAERLPENIAGTGSGPVDIEDTAPLAQGERQGSYVVRGGQFKRVVGEGFEDADWLTIKKTAGDYDGKIDAKERARRIDIAKDWIGLRTAARALFDAENNENAAREDLDRLRADLNKVYDAYVKKHGTLTKEQAHLERAAFLRDDDDYPLLQSMEQEKTVKVMRTRKGKEVEVAAKEFVKGDIFTKRIRKPRRMPKKADTTADAIGISLGYRNTIDVDLVAQLRGITPEQAKQEVLDSGRAFENPETGLLEPKERYLSGNVRVKLEQARKAVADAPQYERNVSALEAVQPARVPIAEVDFTLSSRWIPPEVTSAFATSIFEAPTTVLYAKGANGYTVVGGRGVAASETWGTADVSGQEILTHALNGTMPEVTKSSGSGKNRVTWVDRDATVAAQAMVERMQKAFVSWAKTTSDEITFRDEKTIPRDSLEQVYNEVNNSVVPAQYDGSYLVLPGLTDTVRRLPHRLSVVARVLQEGSAVMAHGVGSGKTFSQIVLAMEMRRLGLSKKPMIVVQKATIGQFAASFRQAYPDARILVANERTFAAKNRKRLMAQIALGDYDAVIVTQPQFDLLDNKPETMRAFINSRISELESAIREAKADEGGRSPTVKQLEASKKSLEAKLGKMLEGAAARKDRAVYFEELGVDSLLIDEAHAYKRMALVTRKVGVKGIPTGQSQRSMGLELKASQIQARNGGRNVILATGTPITNTMAEAYVMLKLATPNVLREYHIDTFDDFANTFGTTQTKLEVTWSNRWKMVTRFNRFTNGAELVAMIRAGFDVKMGNKELGLKVPAIKGGKPELVKIKKTAGGEQIDGWLGDVATTFENLKGKERAEAGWVPIFTMQAGMAAALDPRLIDPSLPDEPGSKVNVAADRIAEIYKRTDGVSGTQLVFADRFKPMNTALLQEFAGGATQAVEISQEDIEKEDTDEETDGAEGEESAESVAETKAYKDGGFNLYQDLRDKLVARGIPREQIAIIHEYDNDKKREQLFAAVNRGDIRVLIGSTEKMGVGVNVQERLVALHHLDPPRMLTPAMMEQRNGRGIRQGNMLLEQDPGFEIEILNYGTERSMDTAIYQKLEDKGRMLAQVLAGKGVGRSFEDAAGELSAVMAEFKAALTGDARVLRKLELENEVQQLRGEQAAFETELGGKVSRARGLKHEIAYLLDVKIPPLEHQAKVADAKFGDPDSITLTTGSVTATGRKDVSKAIDAMVEKVRQAVGDKPGRAEATGDLMGMVLTVKHMARPEKDSLFTKTAIGIETPGGTVLYAGGAATGSGLFGTLSGIGDSLRRQVAEDRAFVEDARKRLAVLNEEVKRTWDKADALAAAERELAKIDDDLQGKKAKTEGVVTRPGETLRERAVSWLQRIAGEARRRRLSRGVRMMSGPPLDDIIDLGIEVAAKMLAKGITRGPTLTRLITEGVKARGEALAQYTRKVRTVARRIIKRSRGLDGRPNQDLMELAIAKEQGRKATGPEGREVKAAVQQATGVSESGEPKDLNRQLGRDQRTTLRAYNQGIREGMANVQAQIPALIQKTRDEARTAYLKADIRGRSEEARRAAVRKAQTEAVERLRDNLFDVLRTNLPPQARGKYIRQVRKVATLGQYLRAVQAMQIDLGTLLRRQAMSRLTRTVGSFVKPKAGPTLAQQVNKALGIKRPTQPFVTKIQMSKLRPEHRAVVEPVVKSIREAKVMPDLTPLADFIEDQMQQGRSAIFSGEDLGALRMMGPRDLSDPNLRPDALLLADRALRHVAWLSASYEKARVMGKMVDLQAMADQAAAQVSSRKKVRRTMFGLESVGEKNWVMQFFGDRRRDTARMMSIAGGRDGVLYRTIYENVADGEDKALLLRYEGINAIKAVVARHRVTEADLAKMGAEEVRVNLPDAGSLSITPAERMHLLGPWSDPQNRPEIIKGGLILERFKGQILRIFKMTDADFDALEKSATGFEMDLLRTFKTFANGRLAQEGNRASVETQGVELFTNPEHFSRSRDQSVNQQNTTEQNRTLMQTWLEDMGVLKARSTTNLPVIVKDFFRFADQHIDRLSRYAHLSAPVRTALLLIGNPTLRTELDARLGTQWTGEVETRLNAVSGVASSPRSAEGHALRRFVGNYAVSVLGFNPTTIVLQKVGLLTAAADADNWGEAGSILAKVPQLNVLKRTLFAEMTKHSGYLMDRYGEGSSRLVDPTQYAGMFASGAGFYAKVKKASMTPMELMDQDGSIGIYAANKARIRKTFPHMTEEQVQREAARETALTVRRTQNATSELDRTGQGILGHQNAFAAMWTLFSSAAMKMGNQVEEAASELYHNPSKANAARLTRAVLGLVVSTLIAALIRELYRRFTHGFQDEKNPKTMGDLGIGALADLADTFTLGGAEVVRGILAKPGQKASPNSFMELATDIVDAGKALMERNSKTDGKVVETKDLLPKIERGVLSATKLLGVVGSPVYVLGRGVVRLFGQPKGEPWSIYAAVHRGSKEDAAARVYDYLERNKDNPRVATNLIEAVKTRARGGRTEREYAEYLRTLTRDQWEKERDRFQAEWALFGDAVRDARGMQRERR